MLGRRLLATGAFVLLAAGVGEVLALVDTRLLVLERSGVNEGCDHWTSHIRIYEADAPRRPTSRQ